MRLMEVLPNYEASRYDRPPTFTNEERRSVFKLDLWLREVIKTIRRDENKIGLLIQYSYFKVAGRFFLTKVYRSADIKAAAKEIGVTPSKDIIKLYTDRTRQKHRLLILKKFGYLEFNNAIDSFDDLVTGMVDKQMHPRKLFYVLVEELRQRKIELPSYDKIVRTITDKFHQFEEIKLNHIAELINDEQVEALNQLVIADGGDAYERALLTRIKHISQSTRPAKIKKGMRNFLIIKKLYNELTYIVDKLSLSAEATAYYAGWVNKAKVTQLADMVNPHKRNLHLIAFIEHWYKLWQDNLVDILLKSVQQMINKVTRDVDDLIKEKLPEKNRLTKSVLSGFTNVSSDLHKVRLVAHDRALTNDEKIKKIHLIVPEFKDTPLNKAETDAKELQAQIEAEKKRHDELGALNGISRKLQNRVAEIIKHLEFTEENSVGDLYTAIQYYQNSKKISSTAPSGFLDDHEYSAVYRDDKFNVSLYKAILFCKIAQAIKSGQISLNNSFRYLSIDAYLIDEKHWNEHKEEILKKLGLSEFDDIKKLLSSLKSTLDNLYVDVNRSIIQGKNKHIKINKDGSFSLHTPAVEKPDYDSIPTIVGKGKYIPILKMMAEINASTKFTSCFKHHKISGSKATPENEVFYAGIFGLGSNIGLHKLANTAIGINYNTLSNAVNWYFSLDNLYAANQAIIDLMSKLWLPQKFKRERELLHTSSDAKKQCVSAESLNTNHSYKYFGHGRGASVYRFIDERSILFYSTVFSSSERDAAYVVDGLLHNDAVASNIHSTDTHGYTEMVFGVSHLINVTFAPRIKDISTQKLVSFDKIKSQLDNQGYPIKPTFYVNENKIIRNWDNILRLVATIKLREHRASTILKRLTEFSNQHPLEGALKEFGRIIKSIFILKYIDDVEWRQMIEKQLNKGELANKFSSAVSFADQNILEPLKEDQEITVMCKTLIQNIIILWNYIELTKIIMNAEDKERDVLLENIINASILTWQHVNLHGTYDFSNLLSANDDDYLLEDVINFKAA